MSYATRQHLHALTIEACSMRYMLQALDSTSDVLLVNNLLPLAVP